MKDSHPDKVVCASKAVILYTNVKFVVIQNIFITKNTTNNNAEKRE